MTKEKLIPATLSLSLLATPLFPTKSESATETPPIDPLVQKVVTCIKNTAMGLTIQGVSKTVVWNTSTRFTQQSVDMLYKGSAFKVTFRESRGIGYTLGLSISEQDVLQGGKTQEFLDEDGDGKVDKNTSQTHQSAYQQALEKVKKGCQVNLDPKLFLQQ